MPAPADFAAVAVALRAEEAVLDLPCAERPPPPWGESEAARTMLARLRSYEDHERPRALRRLESWAALPPLVRDAVLGWVTEEVARIDAARHACGQPFSSASTFAVPPVDGCAEERALAEIAAADLLWGWGYEGEADTLASAATRWMGVRCPRLRAETRREPVRCDCGSEDVGAGRRVWGYPSLPIYGGLEQDFELWRFAYSCVGPERGEALGYCPTFCVPVAWVRSGGTRARHASPLLRGVNVRSTRVYTEARPSIPPAFAAAAKACDSGGAEWLGQWMPWDERPGSACLARVAGETLAVHGWTVVLR